MHCSSSLSQLLSLLGLHGSVKGVPLLLGQLGTLVLLQHINFLFELGRVIVTVIAIIRLKVQGKEELARGEDNLGVIVEDSTPDSVDSLLIVPHLSLVKFNHNVERPTRSIFIGVLEESLDELLEFLVDVMLL